MNEYDNRNFHRAIICGGVQWTPWPGADNHFRVLLWLKGWACSSVPFSCLRSQSARELIADYNNQAIAEAYVELTDTGGLLVYRLKAGERVVCEVKPDLEFSLDGVFQTPGKEKIDDSPAPESFAEWEEKRAQALGPISFAALLKDAGKLPDDSIEPDREI